MAKFKLLVGASSVGVSLLASPGALAADLPVKAPPRAAWMDSWAGPYIGAYFGAGAGRATDITTQTFNNTFVSTLGGVVTNASTFVGTGAQNISGDVTGSMVDLFAGHNWRTGNVVYGGQVEGTVFSDVTMKQVGNGTFSSVSTNTVAGISSSGTSTGTVRAQQQLHSRVGLIGRVGFLARPDLLLYGLGGLELGHFSFPDNGDVFGGPNGKWAAGFTVGAGGEVKLTDNWSLRGEYRYLNFRFDRNVATASTSSSVSGATTSLSTANETSASRTGVNMHLAKIGLVYQFGDIRPLSAMAAIPPKSGTIWSDSWAGPYVGAYFSAGAGRARETFARTDSETNVSAAGTVTSGTQSASGNFAGDMTGSSVELFAGYNWRSGGFVAGGQVEGTLFSDITTKMTGVESQVSTSSTNGVVTSTSSSTRTRDDRQQLRSNVGLIGRAGYLVTPNVLLYGIGGLSLGHFTYPDGYPDIDNVVGGPNGKWVAGYTVGGGGEVKLTDNWSLRGEYRYTHFGFDRSEPSGSNQTSVSAGGTSTSANATSITRHIDTDFHTGKVGVVYRFGEPGSRSAMAAMPGPAWNDGWAGPYIGAYFGAGAGRAKESFTTTQTNFNAFGVNTSSTVQNAAGNPNGDMTGSTVDLFAGYNWRNGNAVIGGQIEGTVFSDVTLNTIGSQTFSSTQTTNGAVTSTVTSASSGGNFVQQQLRSNVGAIARAGYLVTPNVLLYGLGGLSLGHFTYPDGDFRDHVAAGKWVAGYTVGAGGEVKLTENWSLRGEYRYQRYGFTVDERFGSTSQSAGSTGSSSDNTTRQIDADFHTGKVGLVYRFGEPGPRTAMASARSGAVNDGWAGPYIGAQFGAGAGHANQALSSVSTSAQQNFTGAVQTVNFFSNGANNANISGDKTGSMVDLFAGYNWRAGNIVVGGQVEGTLFSDVAFKATGTQATSFVSSNNGVITTTLGTNVVQTEEQLRSNVGVVGRAGMLVTPKVLLYGLGGFALGHFTFPDSNNFGGANGKWVAGYTAGAGGEYKVTERWSLRGEYRYLHFDIDRTTATSSSSTTFNAPNVTILRANTDSTTRRTAADMHLAKIGAVYSFCYCD